MIRLRRASPSVERSVDPAVHAMLAAHRTAWASIYRSVMRRNSPEWRAREAKRVLTDAQLADYRTMRRARLTASEALSSFGVSR